MKVFLCAAAFDRAVVRHCKADYLLFPLVQFEMKMVEVHVDYDNGAIGVKELKEKVLMTNVVCRTIQLPWSDKTPMGRGLSCVTEVITINQMRG